MFDRDRVMAALAKYEAEHEFARQIIPPVEDLAGMPPQATR